MASSARWRLDGKRALVTGGTLGIGKATVEELCALGARVFTCGRQEARLEQTLLDWRAAGLDVSGVACDVSTSEGRETLLLAVREWSGGVLEFAFLNAGTNIRKATVDYTAAELETVLGLNMTSTFVLTQLLHPLLLEAAKTSPAGASLVFNSSVAGVTAISSGTPYAMSKAALNQLASNLCCEWGRTRIRVNSVCPWYTRTPLAAPVLEDGAKLAAILERTPLGRIAEAEEVAACVAFLCMPASSYVTGQTLVCDGGFSKAGYYVF